MTVSLVDQLTPELLWAHVQSLLPLEPSNQRGGRPRIPARQVLAGIVFVLRHGLPWRSLPQQLGFGSGLTCRRTMVEWTEAGLWEKVHHLLLEHLQREDLLDWSRASADSASIRRQKGGLTGPNPTDRGKKGTKIHLVVDASGIPLGLTLSGANVHDSKELEECIRAIHLVYDARLGYAQRTPDKLHADKGDDFPRCRLMLRCRGIEPRIARRGVDSSVRLGQHRWKVERTFAWLISFRRLAVRYERQPELYRSFCLLACALIVVRRSQRRF
ncbi:IS5 family transposase [Deinococcus ficus]|uniref:IS5 family transposase n=1 Tax=Deinococcus ficus TaxID=317577 RepID=UPI000D58C775